MALDGVLFLTNLDLWMTIYIYIHTSYNNSCNYQLGEENLEEIELRREACKDKEQKICDIFEGKSDTLREVEMRVKVVVKVADTDSFGSQLLSETFDILFFSAGSTPYFGKSIVVPVMNEV